jgi:hypothetical protein
MAHGVRRHELEPGYHYSRGAAGGIQRDFLYIDRLVPYISRKRTPRCGLSITARTGAVEDDLAGNCSGAVSNMVHLTLYLDTGRARHLASFAFARMPEGACAFQEGAGAVDNDCGSTRHCEAASAAAAIHYWIIRSRLDCFASLAMTLIPNEPRCCGTPATY